MIVSLFKFVGNVLKSFWRGLSVLRRVAANLAFLAILVVAVLMMVADRGKAIPHKAALIVSPSGLIVEQESERMAAGELLGGESRSESLLQDLIKAIDHAATDARVQAIVLDLDELQGGGTSKLQDIGAALKRFRESGKPVVAFAEMMTQQQYFLAAHADRLYLHPMGGVFLTGFGVYRHYYQSALAKLRVRMHVFKVGAYKSALEPFLRDDMSDFDKESNLAWLTDLWQAYRADLAALRGLTPEQIDDYINRYPALLAATDGDSARLALESGLVDGLKTRDQVQQELIDLVGEDHESRSYNQIHYEDYLAAVGSRPASSGSHQDQVGVIVARGIILDGAQPAGRIGSDSLSDLIEDARNDPRIKALVLRLDTNGGSAYASEVVRRELELTREGGTPVVISMGSAAASGGYWIATAADEIWASPTTVTGSIGIFGAFPTFEESLAALGIYNDGVGTTRLADALIPSRPLNPLVAETMQRIVDNGYRTFVKKVADSRGMTLEEVEKIAQGRVWSGVAAQRIGLVDKLGGLREAIESAAALAGVENYGVEYLELPLTTRERLLKGLNRLILSRLPGGNALGGRALFKLPREIREDLVLVEQLNDPYGQYAYCLPCGLN